MMELDEIREGLLSKGINVSEEELLKIKEKSELKQAEEYRKKLHLEFERVNNLRESQFNPTIIPLKTRKDCSIAVVTLWKYSVQDLNISQIFYMVDGWARVQPQREEVIKEIIHAIVSKYCPHYQLTWVPVDREYQRMLKEHSELSEIAMRIQEETHGEDECAFGERRRI
jgi:hypothetical protein